MPGLEQNNHSDFLTEKIKVKPVNKKKLVRRTIVTVSMAVIFGLVACVTFLVLEPVISNRLYPEEEQKVQMVEFPKDQEEMSPEDMLAENLPTESPEPEATPEPAQEGETGEAGGVQLGEEQIQDILSQVTFDLENYKQLYGALSAYANEMERYVVTVTAVTSNLDWFNSVEESQNKCSGVIISENGIELLILTDYSVIESAERLLLTFYDGSQLDAQVKQYNEDTNLAVLSVPLEGLSEQMKGGEEGKLPIVELGYSNARNLAGTPVIAVGSPMGSSYSLGYGMITSSSTTLSMTDRNYRLILTNISGSQNSSGVLFDMQGRMLGIITNNKTGSDMRNLITAYGITELQKTIEKMSNAVPIAYMGIRGGDVPKEANQELGVPFGAYVEEFDMDSPAMRAGIQRGDVITGMGERAIANFAEYSNALMELQPEQEVEVTVMRQSQEEYKEMKFNIELGGAE